MDSSNPNLIDQCVIYLKWITQKLNTYSRDILSPVPKLDYEWIDLQVRYRYGKAYADVINKRWDKLYPQITNSKIKRWLRPSDITPNKVNEAYGEWGAYRHHEAVTHIIIYNLITRKQMSINPLNNILLPINMVDNLGSRSTPFWGYNRRYGFEEHILWPLSSHIFTLQSGMDDMFSWKDKIHKMVFRGATTGPIVSSKEKTSRYEIINRFANCSWTDFGFNQIISNTKTDPNWPTHKKQILTLTRKSMTVKEMLKYRFILCIEGNDISTAFGWVLSSNSVPIHPYPFMFESWFFQGLKPWVHFIPCKLNGSDLEQLMKWTQENDAECQKIAKRGREHMKRMLNPVLYVGVLKRMYELWDMRIKN